MAGVAAGETVVGSRASDNGDGDGGQERRKESGRKNEERRSGDQKKSVDGLIDAR